MARTADEYPATDRPTDRPGRDALLAWSRVVSDGVTVRDLAAEPTAARATDRSRTAAELRLKAALWLGGNNPSSRTGAAIRSLHEAVVGAVHARLDEAGLATLLAAGVEYEWDALARRGNTAAQALLSVLAFAEPTVPFPVRLLADGWGPLPDALRPLAEAGPPAVRPLLTDLSERGLLRYVPRPEEVVQVEREVQDAVRSHLTAEERKEAASALLRTLRVALPSAAHDHATWGPWASGLPHLLAAAGGCELLAIRPADVVYVLERAAVFLRDARDDPTEAIALGRRAEALSDAAGRPVPADHANVLGNIAIALRHVSRHQEAVALSAECAEITRRAFGEVHHEYVEALLAWANALDGAADLPAAMDMYERALRLARQANELRSGSAERETLIEVLNDYAQALLPDDAGGPDRDAAVLRAAGLLDEARRLLRPGGHGWHQVHVGRAEAHYRLGEYDEAKALLYETLSYCDAQFGRDSYPAFSVIRLLIDVLEDSQDPRYREMRARGLQGGRRPRGARPDRLGRRWWKTRCAACTTSTSPCSGALRGYARTSARTRRSSTG